MSCRDRSTSITGGSEGQRNAAAQERRRPQPTTGTTSIRRGAGGESRGRRRLRPPRVQVGSTTAPTPHGLEVRAGHLALDNLSHYTSAPTYDCEAGSYAHDAPQMRPRRQPAGQDVAISGQVTVANPTGVNRELIVPASPRRTPANSTSPWPDDTSVGRGTPAGRQAPGNARVTRLRVTRPDSALARPVRGARVPFGSTFSTTTIGSGFFTFPASSLHRATTW